MHAFTLTAADREHRRAFMDYCVTSAEERYQRRLRVLYAHVEVWGRDFFGGQLFPPTLPDFGTERAERGGRLYLLQRLGQQEPNTATAILV